MEFSEYLTETLRAFDLNTRRVCLLCFFLDVWKFETYAFFLVNSFQDEA